MSLVPVGINARGGGGIKLMDIKQNAACVISGMYTFQLYIKYIFISYLLNKIYNMAIMHQSFEAPAPSGPRNSGAFNFSIFKALLKALHCRAKFVVKSPLKAPARGG